MKIFLYIYLLFLMERNPNVTPAIKLNVTYQRRLNIIHVYHLINLIRDANNYIRSKWTSRKRDC